MGFASCANDGYIRIWSSEGQKLVEILGHPEQTNCPSFIYSIAVLPGNKLASTGEDGSIKIWTLDGKKYQTIDLPAVCRDLCVLPNGDLVTATTEGVVRIWTTDVKRVADKKDIESFEELVKATQSGKKMEGIDESQIKDISVLSKPGNQGQVVIVRTDKGPTVFQFNDNTWHEIGLAMGAAGASGKKVVIDGVEFDHSTDIWLNEQDQVKLGFNREDDPKDVMEAFCAKYGLVDDDHKRQILQHIEAHTDPGA
eukprot:UN28665